MRLLQCLLLGVSLCGATVFSGSYQKLIEVPSGSNGDLFGYSLDRYGANIAVGAPRQASIGSVYFYGRNSSGAFNFYQKCE